MLLQFKNPLALWAFLPVALLVGVMFWQRYRMPGTFSVRRLFLAAIAFSCCVLALARPQMGHYAANRKSLRSNLFLALDISKSMLAEDISPSRLGFSMAFTRKLLETLSGVRVAVFPFAGDGYLQMPLSTDLQAATDLISSLNPSIMTTQGTDFSTSLDTLMDMILHMEQRVKDEGGDWAPTQVLLLSDGETHRPVEERVVRRFRAEHIPIFTVGVGTTAGSFIPVESRFGAGHENLRDREGRTVRTRLEPDSLRKISRLSEGDYFASQFDEVYHLARRLTQSMQIGKLTATFKVEKELFPFFLVIAVLLFGIEMAFGRWEYVLRAAVPAIWLLAGLVGNQAQALSDELQAKLEQAGSNRDVVAYDLGVESSKNGNASQAAELFQEAANSKKNRVRKQSLYNLGNVLMRLSDPVQALQVYQLALDVKTGDRRFDADADRRISDNIVLATRLEQQMRQKQQQQGNGDEKQGADDPHGPREKYDAQQFDETQKQRMFDLVSGEEQQILQRLQGKKNKPVSPVAGKEW